MSDLFVRFGGHEHAAGVTLEASRVDEFRERFNAFASARLSPEDFLPEVALDGVVSLRGDADNQAQKDLTTEYVKDIEGVRDVDNQMTVRSGSAQTRTEAMRDKIDDASITAQVKMTLLGHRSTSAFRTKVETRNGVVSLTGKAKSAAEIDLVTKLVSDVKGGVVALRNFIGSSCFA